MELEFDVLGVPGMLVKYVVQLFKGKIKIKNKKFFTQAAQTTIDQFWS
jgi:hypothetical protein